MKLAPTRSRKTRISAPRVRINNGKCPFYSYVLHLNAIYPCSRNIPCDMREETQINIIIYISTTSRKERFNSAEVIIYNINCQKIFKLIFKKSFSILSYNLVTSYKVFLSTFFIEQL